MFFFEIVSGRFIFQPKGPVSDFVVFIFRDTWATRLDIFTGKHSEPLDRGSDANCPRETYGECTSLWPALLFNTPACTLSRELKAQLQKCQVMTFSFLFENYPTVKWILSFRMPFSFFFFLSSPKLSLCFQYKACKTACFAFGCKSQFLGITDTSKHVNVLSVWLPCRKGFLFFFRWAVFSWPFYSWSLIEEQHLLHRDEPSQICFGSWSC